MQPQHSIFEPSSLPPDPDAYQFRCTNVAFVAACLCADLFDYRGIERGNGSDVIFILDDPHRLASEYLRQVCRWNLPSREPKALQRCADIPDERNQSASGGEAWLTNSPRPIN